MVRIVRTDKGFRLERGGRPFFIKGAVGRQHLEELVAAGGNALRASAETLDRAQESGLSVLVGLRLANPRHGFDYTDRDRVARQLEQARQTVLRYKDHPALLMWALGNEPEIQTTPEQRLPLWRAINEMAEMVKRTDGRHPVITVLGDAYRRILHEAREHCPALDAIGLNSYADMLTMPEDVEREGWDRPYLVTEFGPRGHWQVPKTPWGLPIEDTSTEKAEHYLESYRHAVQGQPRCLGSFVFHWDQHHEKTHTWYGMFLPDGSRTGAVDAMVYAWTGKWPTNRCPRIGPGKIRTVPAEGPEPRAPGVFAPGTLLRCSVDADDPEGQPITVTWDLRLDVSDNPNVGGDREEPTPPIEGAVVSAEGKEARIRIPKKAANYRIFVYVHDPKGAAATANLPITCKG